MLASGSSDTTVKLWDVASGHELRTLRGHSYTVSSVAFSPDGRVLASGSSDKTVKLWDVASGHELRTLSGHSNAVFSVAFSPDGRVLASGSDDNTVKLWDVASGHELRTLGGHSNWVKSVAFSPDGLVLASGSDDNTVKLWDVASGHELRTLSGHSDMVSSVAFSPDGRVLASGSRDNMVRLWDVASGHELRSLSGHTDEVFSVAFSPDGRVLASGSRDKTVKLWDVASGDELRTLSGHSNVVSSVAFSPDGRVLASGSYDNTVKLWDVASGDELRTLSGHSNVVSSVAFSPDGRVLASGSDEDKVKLWDVASGHELRTLSGHSSMVNSVAFSPDGRVLASGSSDKTVKLWDVASGHELRTLSGHSDEVFSVAFSPDGRVLASGSRDKTARLWDVASGHELRTLSGHSNVVSSVAFSPDGRVLASGSRDNTVKLWDISSGAARVTLIGFTDGSFLAITPAGYYDASSEQAEKNLNVRVGNRVFPIGAYREKFYRPDLVKLGLAGNSLSDFARLDSVKVAPVVELLDLPPSTTEPKIDIKLRLTDAGGGIGEVRLFLNGTVVVSAAAIPPSNAGSPVTRSYAIQLVSGPNQLRAVAFNADDSMQSNPATAVIAANLPAIPKANLYAVVIGIQQFKNDRFNTLKYTVSDAQLFAQTLSKYSAPLFRQIDVKLLTTPEETSRDSIMKTLKAMKSVVKADDLFVFYVASHGLVDDGEYFLITSNVGSVSTQDLKDNAVSKEDLMAWIANIPANKKLMVIDTCHAGAALQTSPSTRGGLDDLTAVKILSRAMGTTTLMASTSAQEALEGYQDHGLFTYVLVNGLMGRGDADKSGFVSTYGLAHYVDQKVPTLAMSHFNHEQYPTVETNGQEFPITKVQ